MDEVQTCEQNHDSETRHFVIFMTKTQQILTNLGTLIPPVPFDKIPDIKMFGGGYQLKW